MVFINSDGRFNENWFLIDAQMFGMKGNAAIYIIENNGTRMMIDTTTPAPAMRKILNKDSESIWSIYLLGLLWVMMIIGLIFLVYLAHKDKL